MANPDVAERSRPNPSQERLFALLVGAIFCVSGAPALIYQVAWQRILALHTGVGVYSVATIVTAFMAGLCLGSHVGGLLSARLSPRGALRGFAFLEVGIGVFAACSCLFYYDFLYLRMPWLYAAPWVAGATHFLLLVIPTGLMGMSLPFLTPAMVRRPNTACRTIGFLYGINTLGAAIGALITPWVLIRFLGVRGAVDVGAALNVAAGVGALVVGRLLFARAETEGPEDGQGIARDGESDVGGQQPFALWLALYAASGFCALGLEIAWFRIMDLAVKSTAFTFGTMLSVYLLGLAAGSLAGGPLAVRLIQPLRAFLLCQCLLLTYAGAVVFLLGVVPTDLPGGRWYFQYWQQPETFDFGHVGSLVRLYALLPLVLYGLPTVLMGLSFAILQRAVHDDCRTSGRKVGALQAANIAGCAVGSLAVALVFLDCFGTAGTIRALTGFGVLFAVVGVKRSGVQSLFSPLAGMLVALTLLMPDNRGLLSRLHGQSEPSGMFDEDATGVIALTPKSDSGYDMWINGKVRSWLPFSGVHTQLGAVPALLHPSPQDLAIIGLGSGDTAWAAACRPSTRSVTVFEICSPEERLLRRSAEQYDLPTLRSFLSDERIRIVVADGRNALTYENTRYDLIEADALMPWAAYAGNLYSREFFQTCARRLKPGGLVCTWAPTRRVYRTFRDVFPYVLEFRGGRILVGSNGPLRFDPPTWLARLRSGRIKAYLGSDVSSACLAILRTCRLGEPRAAFSEAPNHDLFPRDEFLSPRGE